MEIQFRALTPEAEDFIASANSRETSKSVMEAIVMVSQTLDEAETIWVDGIGNFDDATLKAFCDIATHDGHADIRDLVWGAGGSDWVAEVERRLGQY